MREALEEMIMSEKPYVVKTHLSIGIIEISWLSVVEDIKNVTSDELIETFESYIQLMNLGFSGEEFLDRAIYLSTKKWCTPTVSVEEDRNYYSKHECAIDFEIHSEDDEYPSLFFMCRTLDKLLVMFNKDEDITKKWMETKKN